MTPAPENVGGVPDDPGVAVPSDRAIPSALDTVETAVPTLAVDVPLPSGLPGPDVILLARLPVPLQRASRPANLEQ